MILKRIKQFSYIGLLVSSILQAQQPIMPSAPGMPQDPQAMMAELEKAAQEIDSFVKSLPENEQKEFYNMVEKIENKIQQKVDQEGEEGLANLLSNPQDFERFMEEISSDVMPQPTQEPVEETKKPKKKVKSKITKKQQSQEEQAIDLINTIIKKTNSFLVKTQGMPELANKVERWGKRKRIYDWQQGLTWETVKLDIEKLGNKINKLLDRDPKNNKYKYLDEFIKDESLYNNIAKLRTNLVEYEDYIEVSPFGIEKMSKPSKSALQKTISSYTESLYRLKLNEELDKIIATYEPRAKKLTIQEEAAQKRAEQEARRPRPAGRTTVAGQKSNGGYYASDSYESDYGYNGYTGGYNAPSAYESSYYPSSSTAATPSTKASEKDTPSARAAAGASKKAGKQEKGKEEGKKVTAGGKTVAKKAEAKPKGTTETIINYELEQIESYLEQTAKAMNKADIDTIVKKQVESTKDAMEKDVQDTISFVQENLNDLINLDSAGNEIKKLQTLTKSYTPLRKKGIQAQLNKILNKKIKRVLPSQKIQEVTIKQSLNDFAQKIDTIEQGIKDSSIKMPTYKQYLLLGSYSQEPANDEEREILEVTRKNVPNPLVLNQVRAGIKKIEQMIESFALVSKTGNRPGRK